MDLTSENAVCGYPVISWLPDGELAEPPHARLHTHSRTHTLTLPLSLSLTYTNYCLLLFILGSNLVLLTFIGKVISSVIA